jgi:hypothetical protein
MHLPPAASWTVDNARWQGRVLAALGVAGALVALFFCFSQPWGVYSILVAVACGLCTAGAALGLFHAANGQLRWDGERWQWRDKQDHAVIELVCVLDLQRLLLVRIACEQGPSLWLWLHSPAMDGRWLALRRAVVGSPKGPYRRQQSSLPE